MAEARHFWFRGFRLFVTPFLRQATEGLSAVRILDCGCGTGANLELLKAFGQPFGFDLTESGLRYGLAAGRRRLVRASVDAVPFPDRAFDLVTSFDVLYGVPEVVEKAAVSEMFRVLRPGGYALVNVAALDMLRGDHSVLGREIRRYDRASLRQLLGAHGFTVVRITYTNAVLFLPMLAVRTWQRRRGLRPEGDAVQDISVPAAPVNLALTAALRVESWWLRLLNSPIGSSLLCLARKPA
jgi:SAM-dependent methyltransferase